MYLLICFAIIGDDKKKETSPDFLTHAQIKIMIWGNYIYSWIYLLGAAFAERPTAKLDLTIITLVIAFLNTILFSTLKFDNYDKYRHGATVLVISVTYILYLAFALTHLTVTYLISKFCRSRYYKMEVMEGENDSIA
jgi:hypothetical protein